MVSSAALRALLRTGATAEQLVAAVEADETEQTRRAGRRRQQGNERMRRWRKRSAETAADVRDTGVQPEKKERSPTPPKEKPSPPEGLQQLEFDGIENSGVTRARAKAPETRLPETWRPDIDERAFALKYLPAELIERTADKFRNYWIARTGRSAVKRDWSATWRNWVIKELEMIEARGPRFAVVQGGTNGPRGSDRQTNGKRGGYASFAAAAARRAAGDDGSGS